MPFQFQLIDAKNDEALKNISSNCPTSAGFIAIINQAIRRLLKRGDFYGTDVVAEFCTTGCYLTWPRWVGTVEAVKFCSCQPGTVMNNWYQFVTTQYPYNFNSDVVLEDAGTAPCYNDITGTTGRYLRYHVVKSQDLNRTITIFGRQYGDQPLQELDTVSGAWINGITIHAANPYGTNTTLVTQIEAITREATQGMAYLYEYDPVTGTVYSLAQFEPNETNPRYRRSRIVNMQSAHGCTDTNGVCWRKVKAKIKLEFIPLVNDRDFLLIDDMDAIAFMVQAIKAEQDGDNQTAEQFILKSIRELNFRDRDKLPEYMTPSRVNAVSGCTIRSA